jgi:hypothetical protein
LFITLFCFKILFEFPLYYGAAKIGKDCHNAEAGKKKILSLPTGFRTLIWLVIQAYSELTWGHHFRFCSLFINENHSFTVGAAGLPYRSSIA